MNEASAFWNEVTSRAGLNPSRRNGEAGFDGGFEAAVRSMLGIDEGRPIAAVLKGDKVTLEATVQAVLAAAAPWSRMMREVLQMLADASSSHTGGSVALNLNSNLLGDKLVATLENFRRAVEQAEEIIAKSPGRRWGEIEVAELHVAELDGVPYPNWASPALQREPINQWALGSRPGRTVVSTLADPPPPAVTGVRDFDAARRDVHAWMRSALAAMRTMGPTQEDRYHAAATARPVGAGWTTRSASAVESDHLGSSLLARLESAASLKTPVELAAIGARLLAVLSKAGAGDPIATLRQEALDIFDLPLWERRHELYSVWIGAVIAAASEDPPQWVLTNDALDFSFGSSRLARFTPESPFGPRGETVLWSELRHPLRNPIGKSRKNGVQPDYSVVAHSSGTKPVGLVVECKQYWKASKRNFRAALIDYARAHTDATVLLANYGVTPASVSAELGLDASSQIIEAFGDVHPFGSGLAGFREAVKRGLDETGGMAKIVLRQEVAAAREAAEATSAQAAERVERDTFDAVDAVVEVRLSWLSGGDLDLWAVPRGHDNADRAVYYGARGGTDWPHAAILRRDVQVPPGCETIKIRRWSDWLIKVRLYSGSWPDDAAWVTVRIGDDTRRFERRFTDADGHWWFVCLIDGATQSVVALDNFEPSGFPAHP